MSFKSLIAVVLVAGASFASNGALAAEPADTCFSDAEAAKSIDPVIAACTALIDGGSLRGAALARAYLRRGVMRAAGNGYDLAIDDFGKVIALTPDDAVAYLERGRAHDAKQEDKLTLADFDRAVALKPDFRRAYDERGAYHMRHKNFERALPEFDRAISLDAGDQLALEGRGQVCVAKGDHKRAIADFDALLAIKPEARWNSLRCMARARANVDLSLALADCNKALETWKSNVPMLWRAVTYVRLKKYTEAIADCDTMIANYTRLFSVLDPGALYLRGIAKRLNGDTVGGDKDLAAAKAQSPAQEANFAAFGIKP